MSGKEFEKIVFTYLKRLGFNFIGYYPFTDFLDAIGYIKPPVPFKIPIKTTVEIKYGLLPKITIERFYKISKDALADKMIIFSSLKYADLPIETKSLLSTYKIEFFGNEDLIEFASKEKIDDKSIKYYEKIPDIFSPFKLAGFLPALSRQIIPAEIKDKINELGLEAWQVFEESVYSIFLQCFNYDVKQLGSSTLFKKEPEGIVVTNGVMPFSFLYECKSSSTKYKMSADDERAYKEYINKKKEEIKGLYKTELKYFVIISPDFDGDLILRRDNIYSSTNVLVIYIKSETLRLLAQWAFKIPPSIKNLINLTEIFKMSEVIVSDNLVKNFIKGFEDKTKNRY